MSDGQEWVFQREGLSNLFWDASLDGLRLTDQNGVVRRVNPAYCRLVHKEAHELEGQLFTIIYREEDRQRILGAYRERVANRHLESRMHRRLHLWDGSELWFDSSVSRLEIPGGTAVLTVLRDITELKKAEVQLRTERTRLGDMLSSMRAGTWDWNILTGEVVFNDRWAEMIGYSVDELCSSIDTWYSLIHPDDRPVSDELVARHMSGEISYYDCECRVRHRDGRWIWIHDRGRIVQWSEDGRPLRMVGTHSDITARKQMEMLVRRSRDEARRLALISERTTDAVVLMDTSGRVDWVNPGFERMSGYTASEVLGADALQLFVREAADPNAYFRLKDSMLVGVREQILCRFKGDREAWLDLELQPIHNEQGELTGFSAVASDVTAQAGLRTRLEAVVDALAEGLVLLDLAGYIVDCNGHAERILGIRREDLIGRSATGPQWQAQSEKGVPIPDSEFPPVRVLRTGEPVSGFVMGVMHPDGNRRWIEVNARLLRDGLGRALGVVASFAEVTERRRMQQAILESEARYRALADNVPMMVWLAGTCGQWTDCNRSWQAFTGTSLARDLRWGWTASIHPEDQNRCLERYAEAFRRRTPLEIEFRLMRHDGVYRWVLDRCAPRYGSDGEYVGFVGGCVDITDRRQMEQELHDANLRVRHLALAVEQAPASIFLCCRYGYITYVNSTFCRVTGYRPEEVLGKNPRILQSGLTPQAVYQEMWANLTGGKPWRGELLNRKKSGELYWELTLLAPLLDDSGATAGYLCVKEDITESKRNAQELESANQRLKEAMARAQELAGQAEAANVSKGEFLANMSHEIRTPMNGILGTAGLLLETNLDAEQREYVEVICTSSESLLTIINDLLDFSKIEAGKFEMESIEMSVREIVNGVAAMLSPLAQRKGLLFETVVEPDVPFVVVGDPGRLRQVLVNLAGNAVKFTEKGTIRITARVQLEPGRPERPERAAIVDHRSDSAHVLTVRFSVTDTGIGIPEHQIERLFEQFTQLDASTTRRFGGTGLGLSICRRLVEMMGGEIGAVSALGIGSEFWFTVRFGLPQAVMSPKEVCGASALDAASVFWEGARCRTAQACRYCTSSSVEMGRRPSCQVTESAGLPFQRYDVDPQVVQALSERKATVLLAEDNVINRRVAMGILKKFGIDTHAAEDGQAAVEALRNGNFDLVLMDIHMPRMDGLEATRAIRGLGGATAQTPIVAMTASVMPEDRSVCLNAGVNDFVSKPVDLASLAAVLNRWLVVSREPASDLSSSIAGPESGCASP